ncbi:Uncharacterised protein [Mycobacteroides abscessus subsp. massiliense]|nr:Uncharacterised protein [Mycobacteroides abscessus subsp. massiliense]
MSGCRVGVLPHDEHADVGQRIGEGAQHVCPGGQVSAARGVLLAEELSHLGHLVGDGPQRIGPAGVNQLGKRSGSHEEST